jgi:D-alanyl-lipoteichoic acid acyltransferase DltB (MBOAT superfamily)
MFITALTIFYPYVVKKIKARTIYLLVFSLFFFYKTSGIFWLLLVGTSLVNFILGSLIYKNREDAKSYLVLSLIWNLGTLCYFKYTNYVINGFNDVFGSDISPLNIIFPAGISFFTFQTMSYTIDIYRKKLKPVDSFLDFAFFVSFFPQLVAGPIVRASYFLPQIKKKKQVKDEDISQAVVLIINGLVKKLIIADFLAVNFISDVFASPDSYSGMTNLFAVYAYAMKIYCDFSAYSDMAIGLAKLLGFSLPENFNLPYKSLSVKEFWSRWHISLSTWLKDYLYIPLGGNKKGNTHVNLFITMLLGGLWHVRPNAFWTYIVWGALHGSALVLHRLWMNTKLAKLIKDNATMKFLFAPLNWIITFNFVCLTWVFFRANSVSSAWSMLRMILANIELNQFSVWFNDYKVIAITIFLAYILHFIPKEWDSKLVMPINKLGVVGNALLISIFLIGFSQFKKLEPEIYEQLNHVKDDVVENEPKYKVQQFEYYKF